MSKMLERLNRYYLECGIHPLYFHCRYRETCEKSAGVRLNGSKCAFVGTEYEKGREVPRLLFLSLDPGNVCPDPVRRTLESVRDEENGRNVSELPKNLHWYRTHELAQTLLNAARPDLNLTVQDSHLYFAHTNSGKCSMDKNKQGPPTVFENCRSYVGGEVKILQPDILATQGKWARIAIERLFEAPAFEKDSFLTWLEIDGRPILWLATHHPRNFGPFNQQRRECWPEWARIVQDAWDCQTKTFKRR